MLKDFLDRWAQLWVRVENQVDQVLGLGAYMLGALAWVLVAGPSNIRIVLLSVSVWERRFSDQ